MFFFQECLLHIYMIMIALVTRIEIDKIVQDVKIAK